MKSSTKVDSPVDKIIGDYNLQEKITKLLEEYKISFGELAQILGISKQTLTKKIIGTMDFTYPEMTKLIDLFHIDDPQEFFFS